MELSSACKELQEKEERVTELEQTLKGTSLLVSLSTQITTVHCIALTLNIISKKVRKLEEQNAVSLMNRGLVCVGRVLSQSEELVVV